MLGTVGRSQPHDNMQPFMALLFIVCAEWTDLLPRGSVVAYAGEAVPNTFALCDGVTPLAIPELDPVFGGVAPNLSNRVVVGAGRGVGLSERGIGVKGGQFGVALVLDTLPAHGHDVRFGSEPGTPQQGPGGASRRPPF